MTKNLLVCTSSMMAIVFGAAGSAAAQNHVHHNNMGNACVLGSGNSGNCSGAVRVTDQIQIQSAGAPMTYSAPVAEIVSAPVSSCAGSIAQKVPCDGNWVRSGGNSHGYTDQASTGHTHYGHSNSNQGATIYSAGHGAAYNGSGSYASGPLHSVPRGYVGEANGHAVYQQSGPGQYGSAVVGSYGTSGYSSGYSSSYSTSSSTDTGYFVAGSSRAPVSSGSSYSTSAYSAPVYNAPIPSAPVYSAPVYSAPVYSAPVYTAPYNYVSAPMPIEGISPVFFYGGSMGGVGANVHGGYGGGGGSYFSGGSRFSGIGGYTRLTPPGPKGPPQPPPPPPPPH